MEQSNLSKTTKLSILVSRLLVALILGQTLFFKFSGSSESVEIFTKIGIEPWGRISVGILELMASIFLLISPTVWIGALLAFGLMIGAIFSHIFWIGIEVQGDHGYLFCLSLIAFLSSSFILYVYSRKKMITFTKNFLSQRKLS